MRLPVIALVRIVHELNRQYCLALGDTSQETWPNAPAWQRNSASDGVRFHLSRFAVGLPASPEASHENWLKTKAAEGWTYGPVKDVTKLEHPCFVPYAELPETQRLKDALFVSTVYILAPLVVGGTPDETSVESVAPIEPVVPQTGAEAATVPVEYIGEITEETDQRVAA
jgi:hypothetical protein